MQSIILVVIVGYYSFPNLEMIIDTTLDCMRVDLIRKYLEKLRNIKEHTGRNLGKEKQKILKIYS